MLHQAGSGVLGPVFRAFDSPRDRLVAVKVFRLEVLPEQVVRLADALRRLQSTPPVHPLIVPLLDVGLEGTTPYVVMSFQPGETLDIVLRRAMPMPIERALRILRPLAAILTSAADAGILHGALHPRDVFVHEEEGGLAGVTGFGIVQALEAAGMSNPLQRRPYVAPERGSAAWDARADVFSLGVIAHELLTGRRPAPSGDQDGVFAKEMAPEHRVRLRKVLSTALADSPEQRFRSADALIGALDEVGQRSSVVAPRTADQEIEKKLGLCPRENTDKAPEAVPAEPDALEVKEPADEFVSEGPVEPPAALPVASTLTAPVDEIAQVPVVVPAVGQADAWLDTALTSSPAYEIPAGIFDTAALPRPRRSSVLVKTLVYATAGLLLGIGGGLWVARTWYGTPDESTPEAARIVAKAPVRPEPAPTRGEDVPLPAPPPATPSEVVMEPEHESAPTADARPAVAAGRLVVRSQPSGALVTIDGRHFGATPVAKGLALGTHDVQVAHPGHVPRNERVTIRAAAPVLTLDVTLAPGLESTPPPSTSSTRGAIDVDSRPRGARVIVDGRFVGLTPLRFSDVGPGDHQVTLELGGYRSATGRVRVDGGRTAELTATLRAVE